MFSVYSLAVFDDGGGPALFVGGGSSYVWKWDGQSWSRMWAVGGVPALGTIDLGEDGQGAALYIGTSRYLYRWDGIELTRIGTAYGSHGFYPFFALTAFDDGSGPALYVGGIFRQINEVVANGITRWDGNQWSALGEGENVGVGGDLPCVEALEVFCEGDKTALFAGGLFESAGGLPAPGIARWDGSDWSAVGNGTVPWVGALATFDDGNGEALYTGGSFEHFGGVIANGIARWDGFAWSPLDSGLAGGPYGTVAWALEVFDDGGGSDLYIGGEFETAGGLAVHSIARWGCISADIDGDGDVDQADLSILLAAYGSEPGDPHWDWRADLNGDDRVGQSDLGILLSQWS